MPGDRFQPARATIPLAGWGNFARIVGTGRYIPPPALEAMMSDRGESRLSTRTVAMGGWGPESASARSARMARRRVRPPPLAVCRMAGPPRLPPSEAPGAPEKESGPSDPGDRCRGDQLQISPVRAPQRDPSRTLVFETETKTVGRREGNSGNSAGNVRGDMSSPRLQGGAPSV